MRSPAANDGHYHHQTHYYHTRPTKAVEGPRQLTQANKSPQHAATCSRAPPPILDPHHAFTTPNTNSFVPIHPFERAWPLLAPTHLEMRVRLLVHAFLSYFILFCSRNGCTSNCTPVFYIYLFIHL